MIRIVYIGKVNKKRIDILKNIDKSIIDVIESNNINDINKKLPNDVIDLFIINKLPKICNNIKENKKLKHIPIISLINKHNVNFNTDLLVSNRINHIEFLYQVKTLIKMKLIDDELKKEKILLELKVKDRTNELESKADKLRITLNSIGDGVIVTDVNGNITSINPVAKEICDLPKNDDIKSKVDDLFNVFVDNKKINVFNNIIENKYKTLTNNVILKTKSKKELRVRYTSSTIFNKKNEMTGIVLVFRDNTKEYTMRNQLVLSEEKYRRIYNNVPDMIFTLDLDGNITNVNKVNELGYNMDDLIGESIDLLLDKNNIEIKNKNIQEKIDNPYKITQYELTLLTKDNDRIPFEIKSLFLFDENNKPKEIFGIARNIKDKKESEKKLIESEKKFKLIFDNSNDPIMVSELTPFGPGKFLMFNKSACIGTGYSEEELYKLSPREINEPDSIEIIERDVQELFKNGSMLHDVVIIKKDGDKFYAENNLHIINFEGKKAFLSIGRDISKRKKAELELIRAKEKAEESDRLKGEFITNMTHEIRTPMNSILGFVSQINKDLSSTKLNEYLSIINSSGQLLLTILEDLIDISKINTNTLVFSKDYFDVKDLLINTDIEYEDLKINRNKNNVKLILDSDKFISCETYSDQKRIKQVLNNLIVNAIKFTDEGSITYGYDIEDKFIKFYVKDTGIGIDDNDLSRVFDRFVQINYITKKKQDGTGLGLTISKAIIEMLGGKMWVKSEIDKGTIFYFTIPIQTDYKRKNPKKLKSDLSYNWAEKKVLIVEDNLVNFELMELILKSTKINIDHVDSGIGFYNLLRTNEYDLILLDIQLKDISGYDLLKFVKKNFDIPVIIQSAFATRDHINKSHNLGAVAHISKPINWQVLLSNMDKSLNKLI
jgi:PAS domain S-box-containing protein